MQIQVTASDANNIICQVTPTPTQTVVIDRGVAGNGIVSIVPVTIGSLQYLRITYTDGTVSDVGPITSTAYTATPPINIVGNVISLLTVPIASGGTGATTAATAIENLLPSYTGNGNKRLGLNSGATALEWVADGGGTVTSVDVSGGTTGLTASGGPITTSGTITLAGTLAIANGGSGATTAQAAMNAFAGAVTAGSYLRGDGTNVVMATIQAADVPTLNQNTTGTAANVTGIVAIANGGTGTATPSLVQGTNITITGSWPNQTINSSGGANVTVSNDTTTTSNLYPLFATATSGTVASVNTSDAKLLYKPSTGELQASALVASNGLILNSATVAVDYTVPAGSNALSSGPVTINSGITVTVSSGSVWVVV